MDAQLAEIYHQASEARETGAFLGKRGERETTETADAVPADSGERVGLFPVPLRRYLCLAADGIRAPCLLRSGHHPVDDRAAGQGLLQKEQSRPVCSRLEGVRTLFRIGKTLRRTA